jgi:hypothetical protein
MKATKIVLTVAGLVGLLSIFALPYMSGEIGSLKYWEFREMPSSLMTGLLNGPKQVYVALICFLVPTLLGALALATKQLARWQAIVSTVFFLVAFGPEGVRKGLIGAEGVSTAIGGKLLFLAALIGLITSIVGIAKPEKS